MAGKLVGRALSNTANVTLQSITVGNSTSNSVINSTAVVTPSVNVGSNVFVNTSTIHLGNSTVNTVIHTTGFTGNGAGLHGINADSIATGTLNTSRLPATVNVSTAINVGSNLNINTSAIFIGNSTVNTTIIAGNVDLQGTQLRVGNVIVNGNQLSVGNVTITDAQITVGNSTVNTVLGSTGSLSGNGSQLTSVNAIALEGNSVANILTSANTAANTLAAAAFTNAASRADAAYSNAVSYAASNTYVNNTFLPLAGGTLTGALTINATANVVANLAANNVVVRGDIQIDGNLTVTGTSVTLNVASLAVEDNMIYLNGGSQVSHPDLGIAGNYNDGSYKHAGFFRDATDGVWKVFDGYTPEPDASAYIDTSNASFRIAHFTANVITANGFTGNGASITSVDAATVGGNTAATLRSYSDTVAATAFSNAALRADAAYSNAIAYSGNAALAFSNAAARADAAYTNATSYASNATNISSGTLNTARLPATVNVSTAVNVGANVNANTSTITVGNSTVYSSLTSTTVRSSGAFEPSTSDGSWRNAAFRGQGSYGGAISLVDSTSGFALWTQDNGANFFIGHGTPTTNARIVVTVSNTSVTTFAGNVSVGTAISVGTNTATFGTAAYVVANGNVGIGNSTPTNKLRVEGDASIVGAISGVTSISASANLTISQNINGGSAISVQNSNTGGTAYSQIGLGDSGNTNRGGVALLGTGYSQSSQYRQTETYVYNNGTSGITIHAEDAASSVKLAAGGGLALTANTTYVGMSKPIFSEMNGVVLHTRAATAGNHHLIRMESKQNQGSDMGFLLVQDESAFCDGSGAEDLRFTIGVYNDFRQSSGHSDELWLQGGGRLVYNVGSWDSELNTIIGTPGAGGTGGYEWRSNNSIIAHLAANGNFGIGTTSPAKKLQVNGDALIGANAQRISIFDDGNAHIHSTSLPLWINCDDNGSINLNRQTTGDVILTNASSGKVGIGANTPGAKLHVTTAAPSGIAAAPSGTGIILENSGNNFISLRHSADSGSWSGLAFIDNNIGGFVVHGDNGGSNDRLHLAGYHGVVLQGGSASTVNPSDRTTLLTANSVIVKSFVPIIEKSGITVEYNEGGDCTGYTNNNTFWSNTTRYNMTTLGPFGNCTVHGWDVANKVFVLTLTDLVAHNYIMLEAYIHCVDSWDSEYNYVSMTNNANTYVEYVRFNKVYNTVAQNITLSNDAILVWNDDIFYSYRPWASGSYRHDGFAYVSTNWQPHTAGTVYCKFETTLDQAAADEAFYISHVKVSVR